MKWLFIAISLIEVLESNIIASRVAAIGSYTEAVSTLHYLVQVWKYIIYQRYLAACMEEGVWDFKKGMEKFFLFSAI